MSVGNREMNCSISASLIRYRGAGVTNVSSMDTLRFSDIDLFFTVLVVQGGNLFGYQSDEKHKYRGDEEQGAHVGETLEQKKGIEIINQTGEEKTKADREKQFQWRIQGADLEDNQQKADTISHDTNMAFSFAPTSDDRYISHRMTGAEKAHGNRRGV